MAKTKKKSSKGKSAQKQPKTKDPVETFREGLQNLPPQERIAAARPFWESISKEERTQLLVLPLDELTVFAEEQAERWKAEADIEAAEALQMGQVAINLEPPLDELFSEALARSKANGTWKVWQWRAADKEFYDSDSFRKYMEENLLTTQLIKFLPREEEGAKVPEKPAENAFRLRMQALHQQIQDQRIAHEEANQARRNNRRIDQATLLRDLHVEQLNLMLTTLEKEHEALYQMILRPVTAFVCDALPEGSRRTTRSELAYEDLEMLAYEDVARISEWVLEKVDSLTSKLKPEAKELEIEDGEEPIGDVDLFTFTEDGKGITVNSKWLGHLMTRLLGEDGQPRKAEEPEDPTTMGLVLEWAYGTIVSTAEKAREGAKRALGNTVPTAEQALETLYTTLEDQAGWETRQKQARELLAAMLASRKEADDIRAKYKVNWATEEAKSQNQEYEKDADNKPIIPPLSEDVPNSAILAAYKREQLLTSAKLHYLGFDQMQAARKLKTLKLQLRQGEPEYERLKKEFEEVKNAPRGLEGTFRSTAEMERQRAQLTDAAIGEQLEVQTAVRDQGNRITALKKSIQELEVKMAKIEQEIHQLTNWRMNVATHAKHLEELVTITAKVDPTTNTNTNAEASSAAIDELTQAVKNVTGVEEQIQKQRQVFNEGPRRQMYTDKDDREFFDIIKGQLKIVDKRVDEGRVALQHLEQYFINVACDDPGATIGVQIILPFLTERLDGLALEYAALKAEEAENEVIKMEAERAERERVEKEKKLKAKQKAKEKVRAEKDKERAELEAAQKEAVLKAEEEKKRKEQEQEELRRKREAEVEAQRQREEELMEQRRQELLSDEHSYWRLRQEQEEVMLAEQARLQEQLRQETSSSSISGGTATKAKSTSKANGGSANDSGGFTAAHTHANRTKDRSSKNNNGNGGRNTTNNNKSVENGKRQKDTPSSTVKEYALPALKPIKATSADMNSTTTKPASKTTSPSSKKLASLTDSTAVVAAVRVAPAAATPHVVSTTEIDLAATTTNHHQQQPGSPESSSTPPPPPPTPALASGSQSPVKLPAPSTPDRNDPGLQSASSLVINEESSSVLILPPPAQNTGVVVQGVVAAAGVIPPPPPPPPPLVGHPALGHPVGGPLPPGAGGVPPHYTNPDGTNAPPLPPYVPHHPAHMQPVPPPPRMMYYGGPPPPPSMGGPPPHHNHHSGGMAVGMPYPPPPPHQMMHPQHHFRDGANNGSFQQQPSFGGSNTNGQPTRLSIAAQPFVPSFARSMPTAANGAFNTNGGADANNIKQFARQPSPRGILEEESASGGAMSVTPDEVLSSGSHQSTSENGSDGPHRAAVVGAVVPPPPPPPRRAVVVDTPPTGNTLQQQQAPEEQQQVAVVKDIKDLKSVRGLTNAPGLYNCFLNVIIQTLWHLHSFREALLALSPTDLAKKAASSPSTSQDVAVLTALWNIFSELGQSDASGAVSASELRHALGAKHTSGGSRFKLDDMHDASEALEEIFECLHRAQVHNSSGTGGGFVEPKRVVVAVSDAHGWGAVPLSLHTANTTAAAAGGVPNVQNGVGSTATQGVGDEKKAATSVWGNGAALAKVKQAPPAQKPVSAGSSTGPSSAVQRVFALEVQVPIFDPSNTGENNNSKTTSPKRGSNSNAAASKASVALHLQGIEALQYTKYFHLVNASALRAAAAAAASGGFSKTTTSFEQRLIAAETHEGPTTVAGCSSLLPMTRLLSRPQAVTLGIVWDTPQASTEALSLFMAALDTSLDISKAFAGINTSCRYQLRGLVCYSRSHYKAFAMNEEAAQWLLFDDANVSMVGSWSEVVSAVSRDRLQPSVLFYEKVVVASS